MAVSSPYPYNGGIHKGSIPPPAAAVPSTTPVKEWAKNAAPGPPTAASLKSNSAISECERRYAMNTQRRWSGFRISGGAPARDAAACRSAAYDKSIAGRSSRIAVRLAKEESLDSASRWEKSLSFLPFDSKAITNCGDLVRPPAVDCRLAHQTIQLPGQFELKSAVAHGLDTTGDLCDFAHRMSSMILSN